MLKTFKNKITIGSLFFLNTWGFFASHKNTELELTIFILHCV